MQEMTYLERENLKFLKFGDQAAHVITMVAHWHRQPRPVPFSDYAANWAAAQTVKDVSRLREAWPHTGKRMILDDCSDWQFNA